MIEIKVNNEGERIGIETAVKIKGYRNAVEQFVVVLESLDKTSKEVLADALEIYLKSKLEEFKND